MKKLLTVCLLLLFQSLATADSAKALKVGQRDLKLGIVGDSISDEYYAPFGGAPLGYEGYEWGSILVLLRDVYLGPYKTKLTVYGQPEGYAYNHALKGQAVTGVDNTFDFLAQIGSPVHAYLAGIGNSGQSFADQASELALEFTGNKIDAAVIQGGANDLFIHNITSNFAGISVSDRWDANMPYFQTLKANILNGFENVLNTPVRGRPGQILSDENVILALLPVFGGPDQQDAVADINADLADLADTMGVPTVNLSASLESRITFIPGPGLVVQFPGAGVNVPLGAASSDDLVPPGDPASVDDGQCGYRNDNGQPGCPTAAYQNNTTNDDNVHPTTVHQGLIANDILQALNDNYGFDIELLTDQEIIDLALGL